MVDSELRKGLTGEATGQLLMEGKTGSQRLREATGVCGTLLFLAVLPSSALSQTCSRVGPTLVFGNVDVLPGAASDSTAPLTISCSGGSPSNNITRNCASIPGGSQSDGTSRRMVGPGGNYLRYEIYSDSSRTARWGSWETGYASAGVTINVPYNSSSSATTYGRVLGAQQTAVPGSYSDTYTNIIIDRYRYNPGSTLCLTGTATLAASFTITATVISSCTIGASPLNFGSSGVLTTNRDASTTLSVQCSNTLPYTVALDGGTAPVAADPTQRKMKLSARTITYGLYRDSARSLPWGSTTGSTTVSGMGTGLSQNLTVYGRVPAQATPSPGTYSDTIVATVTY